VIPVHPLALGPTLNDGTAEMYSGFYTLGCLTAYAKQHRGGELRKAFAFGAITPTQAHQGGALVARLPSPPGVVLLSSYVWNHSVNMACAAAVKQRWPEALVVVGGPHIPSAPDPCAEFFAAHPAVDVAVRQEGEVTLAEVLDKVAAAGAPRGAELGDVQGLTFRRDGGVVRTADRPRALDLSAFPSPYLTGEFDHWIAGKPFIAVETNRGCPYGCTYCDWGSATLSKIASMPMERVLGEIDFAGMKRIGTVGLCDANFGILPRDLDIARHLADTRRRRGFPREVGYTNAKQAKPRLLEIIKVLRDANLIRAAQIAMETTDETVLKNVERDNIRTSEYRKMIAFFHHEQIPTTSDMMIGLPGQTMQTCRRDLQFFFDHKVMACLFATSIMPNAPMADAGYRPRFAIVTDEEGIVESTYSFTRAEYAQMFELCLVYKLFVKLGLLRYVLYFVQLEHGVKAMDFIVGWLQHAQDAARYPLSNRLLTDVIRRDYHGRSKDWFILSWSDAQAAFLFDGMEAFQREILAMLEREHGAKLEGSDLEAVLRANRAIMPLKSRRPAETVELEHDVVGYFKDLRHLANLDEAQGIGKLAERARGGVALGPYPRCTSYQFSDWALTVGALELPSDLRL
jgi:radical SAM superfamily enzyme YgiQ (UPF0313 family)